MSYQQFNKGGRVHSKKSVFGKKCAKMLNKKIKTDFFKTEKKSPFLNYRLLRNGLFLSIVMFHMVNVKKVVL